jgi:HAMP domain-containing protein
VALLGTPGQGQQPSASGGVSASFAALCRSEYLSAHPDKHFLGECPWSILAAQHQRELILSHLRQYSLITLAAVILLAAVLGWIAAGRTLRPLHRIAAVARAASEHNLSARVAPTGPRDELREVAETFDAMLGRLQTAFEGQQRFIANASHELRTPLAVMRATVDVVLGNPDSTPGDLRGMAADIRVAVDHAEHLIGALLIIACNEGGLTVREEVDLATAAEDVLDTAGLGDRRLHATLEPAVIRGDQVDLRRMTPRISRVAPGSESPPAPGGTSATARMVPLTIAATVVIARSARAPSSTRTRTGTPRGLRMPGITPRRFGVAPGTPLPQRLSDMRSERAISDAATSSRCVGGRIGGRASACAGSTSRT